MLSTWNEHNIIKQLCSNKIKVQLTDKWRNKNKTYERDSHIVKESSHWNETKCWCKEEMSMDQWMDRPLQWIWGNSEKSLSKYGKATGIEEHGRKKKKPQKQWCHVNFKQQHSNKKKKKKAKQAKSQHEKHTHSSCQTSISLPHIRNYYSSSNGDLKSFSTSPET